MRRAAWLAGLTAIGLVAVGFLGTADCVNSIALAETTVSEPQTDEHGVITYTVESEFQYGPNPVRVVLPNDFQRDGRYRVLYVLPVAKGPDEERDRWGDGLQAIRQGDVASKHQLICVLPVFDRLPWYGDNPLDAKIRQESYLLKVVLPLVERNYPVLAEPRGRLLLGFSKSGWGAIGLLLRHPDVFGRAAAWDAPLMMTSPGQYGSGIVLPTAKAFEPYAIPTLLEQHAGEFLSPPERIILMGYGNFRQQTEQAEALLTKLGIAHEYRAGPQRAHHWTSGWVPEAVELLVKEDVGAAAKSQRH
jgi:hypothetical protein